MPYIDLIKLVVIFAAIVFAITIKRPLYQAILAGIFATMLLYLIPPKKSASLVWNVLTDWSSMSLLVILYAITFLQRMLERRSQIKLAQEDLNRLFNNRRVNATIAPLFIGLLPSAAAMILCGDIVREFTDGYLDKKEQAFVTTWFRHIPESVLPTYSSVLLICALAGVPIPDFMLGMIIPVLMLFFIGYFFYIRRLPRETGSPKSVNRAMDALNLLKHLWSLLLIIVLILATGLSVVASILIVIVLSLFVYRFKWHEIKQLFRQAVEPKMLLSTFFILIFKEFTNSTGVIYALPEFFGRLPIPLYLSFSLLFFFGCIISGSNSIIALGTAMAFSAIPDAGVPLMVLLMGMCHAAMQISPTHVCLAVVAEYYQVSMGELVRKTLPAIAIFCPLLIAYYHLLLLVL
ncbi:MAG: DUF401 family protein [Oscillospiraceae bacterium]|jgi:integral membrane protein (TIGR00529 family)